MISRRKFLITSTNAVAATGAALAGGFTRLDTALADTKQPDKMSIGLGGYSFAFLPLLVADAGGYFKKENVEVTLTLTGGGANTMAATLGGSVDAAGLVMTDIIRAAEKKQRVVAFAPFMTRYASDAVISTAAAKKAGITPDMPLKERLSKLKGMTLAISSRGSGTDKLWRYLLAYAGLDPDRDVTLTVVKLDQMYPALKAGQIDGYNTSAPNNNRAVNEGIAVWVARPSQGEVPGLTEFLYTVLAARPEYVETHQATIRKVLKGLQAATELIHGKPKEAAALVHDKFLQQTSLDLLEKTVTDQASAYPADMALTDAMFRQNVDFMQKFGEKTAGVSYGDVVTAAKPG